MKKPTLSSWWRISALTVIVLALITLVGCAKDDGAIVSDEDIDEELKNALRRASEGKGSTYFMLPDATDLSQIPQDPRNPLTPEKVALGRLLYHEAAIGVNPELEEGANTYSCASCHHAAGGFQANLAQGLGEGGMGFGAHGEGRVPNPDYEVTDIDFQPIRSPSTLNSAYQEAQLWNGQFGALGINSGTESSWTVGTPKEANNMGFEGVETQALAGIGVHRMDCDEDLVLGGGYEALFDAAYPDVPRLYRYTKVKAALAIAAYERTLLATEAPFQRWLRGENGAMTDSQKEGAGLFFGKAQCASCHTGPALNSMEFMAIGVYDLSGPGVLGTVDEGTKKGRGGFTGDPADDFKFKVPQLYSLKQSPFYGHGASMTSIRDVIEYKNAGQAENADVPESQLSPEFRPLGLSGTEIDALTDFVENALNDDGLARYEPLDLPSGHCFPNNDLQSRIDLGCE